MSETLTNGVIVPDKGSRDWYADLRSNWLKLDSLMAGGNITINPAQTEGILVATITVGGREYKLYQQDGDVSVKIDPSTENAEYPLVASTSAEANTGSVVMAPAVTVNPSTGAVTATNFKGKLEGNASTATTATKAVQDGAGAVIADTYATKSELNTKANDANVVHKSGAETIDGLKTFSTWQIIDRGLNVSWITGNKEQKSLFLFSTMDDGYQGYGAELKLHSEILNGGFELTAKDKTGTNVKTLIGDSNGSLTWGGKKVLTADNGVTVDTAQTISERKTFAEEVLIQTLKTTRVPTSSNKWGNGIQFRDSTGKRVAFINNLFFTDGSMSMQLHGSSTTSGNPTSYTPKMLLELRWSNNDTTSGFLGSSRIITENTLIMLAKNLTGANITPGGVIDCGNGNGKLKQWYLGADGSFLLANTLPTGIWKSTSFVSLGPNEGGIFIKLS